MSVKQLNVEVKGKAIVISASSESSFIPLYAGKDPEEALKVINDFKRTNIKRLEDQIKYVNRISLNAETQILQLMEETKNETISKT